MIWTWVAVKSPMTAMNRYRTMTQTTMTNSMAKLAGSTRYGAFFGCGHDMAPRFPRTSRDVACSGTGLVPDRR